MLLNELRTCNDFELLVERKLHRDVGNAQQAR